jgi:glycerol-3-phosphate dehydrogenase
MTQEDNSLEFDMFEDMRRWRVDVLVSVGRERLDAEKIALYVVQGLRDMPKLVKLLSEARSHPRAQIISTLKAALENATALEKAREMLLGLETKEES